MKKLFTAIRVSDLEMVRQIIENCSEGSISILFDEVFG